MTVLPPVTLRESREIDNEKCLRCSKCREWKGLDQFSPNNFTRSGRQSHCKACVRAHHVERRAKQAIKNAQKRAVKKAFSKNQSVGWKPKKTAQNGLKRKRAAIKPVSEKRKGWLELYRTKRDAEDYVPAFDCRIFDNGEIEVFRTAGHRRQFQPHHVFRRIKWCHLLFRWCSPELHEWIENNTVKAKEMGLLFTVERGQLVNPSDKDPFGILEEFRELQLKYS